jgi:hypothetical protein
MNDLIRGAAPGEQLEPAGPPEPAPVGSIGIGRGGASELHVQEDSINERIRAVHRLMRAGIGLADVLGVSDVGNW